MTSAITVSTAASRFVEHCRVAKHLSPHTLRAYTSDLGHFAAVVGGTASIQEVDREAVRHYASILLDEKRLRATTVKRRIATTIGVRTTAPGAPVRSLSTQARPRQFDNCRKKQMWAIENH